MTEIKTTELLAQLIEDAKKIGNIENPPFTAERFIVAVIDKTEKSLLAMETNPELIDLMSVKMSRIAGFKDPKAVLMEYINNSKMGFLDDLYMKKKMAESFSKVVNNGGSVLDSVNLLNAIIMDPTQTIRPLLKNVDLETSEVSNSSDGADSKASDTGVEDSEASVWSLDNLLKALREAEQGLEDYDRESEEISEVNAKQEMNTLISDVKRIEGELKSIIFGQDNAINTFVTGYFKARMLSIIDKQRNRPAATFLFAGPPGVGKTFLAEKAAGSLKLPFMRFDMSEYADKEAYLEFCGSDKVYKNSKAGNVTSFVSQHPKCVLLFDEIEKAHISVIHLFLQILDAGRLRDNFSDEEISFSDAIIILTTNAGKQLYEDSESGDFSSVSRKIIIKSLQKDINPATGVPYFPGAICSRFASGNVVMFNHIGAHNLRSIGKMEIERHAANFENESNIKLEIDEHVYTALLFSEGGSADARTIRGRAETFFNDELYELLRLVASDKVKTNIEDIERIRIGVDLSNTAKEVSNLFESAENTRALILAESETVKLCMKMSKDVEIVVAHAIDSAIEAVKSDSIDLVLLDMRYGMSAGSDSRLNIEDIDSKARDFFKFLREYKNSLPIYLIETDNFSLSDEEKISFVRQGVRGVLSITEKNKYFADQLNTIAFALYQQASMVKLARENKLISFETAQTVSHDGKNAEIKLFDFGMCVAVDAEDSKNVLSAVSKPNVHFDEVIGADEAKKELKYFVDYLKDPKKYMGTGVKAPKGVILYGPPGTGKTMLAKAMACESGVTFIAAEGNQFLKKYVGEGSEKVHELFKIARKYAPAILFVDEIDAIAKERRGVGEGASNGEETLTAFLTEMDGFVNDPSRPVFVLAATNFDVEPGSAKSLDPALMRRFDRRVYIDLPNKADRIRFLKMKVDSHKALAISEEQIENIAMRSTGMSLAQLDSVVELALRSAIREGSTVVTDAIFEEAFETFNQGETTKWDISQLERVARHEAGHALLCWLGGETPSYLTIVARGNHGGYMQHAEQEGKAIYTKDELLDHIKTSLGGRAAEIVYYGDRDGISTGASGDLVSATNMAKRMICTYGMDADFGLAVMGEMAANGAMSTEVRASVNRILSEQMAEAVRLVSENKAKIDALVAELMVKNHLNGAEIEAAIKNS